MLLPECEETADDEFYMEDLIGFEAEAELIAEEQGAHRTVHGRLADYYDSEANPLFELELEGRAVLVPAAEEFIARIDFEERTMKFVLPAGLVALQS